MTDIITTDAVDAILGAEAAAAVAPLRDANPRLRAELQAYDDALFRPAPDSAAALPLADRCAVAVRVAAHAGSRAVMDWYAERGRAAGTDTGLISRAIDLEDPWVDQTPLGAAIRHADRVTLAPASVEPEHLAALKAAGLSPAGVVSLSQVIAFVSYQLRLVAALRALAGVSAPGGRAIPDGTAREPFTFDPLGWAPWVERAGDTDITPERRAAIAAHIGNVPHSDYLQVLANDFAALVARAAVHKHVHVPGEAEHTPLSELGATVASRINGCVYCASVHARRYAGLTKERDLMRRLLDQGLGADLPPRERAVADVAALLTRDPEAVGPAEIDGLRAQGLDELQILDALNYTAFFANANRLMLTLGDATPPRGRERTA